LNHETVFDTSPLGLSTILILANLILIDSFWFQYG